MTTNVNIIYNDTHASKLHKTIKKNFEEYFFKNCIEYKTLDLKLPFVINCCRQQSNWMGDPL